MFANAEECMRVVTVLTAFARRYLEARGPFKEEIKCLFLLARIIRLLRSRDKVIGRLSLLTDLLKQHQLLYERLDVGSCIPKLLTC